jgi:hypothetical protein
MQILSALDAISPAFSRTKLILFTPFRKGRTWKLAITAYLSVAGTAFLPFSFIYLALIPIVGPKGIPYVIPVLITLSIVVTLIYLVIFYLCSRLRFAYFDIVLNRGEFVAPAWRKYGSQSFKWTLFKIVLGLVVAALVAAPSIAYIKQMVGVFERLQLAPGQQPPPEMMAAIFSGYAAFFVVYLLFGLYYWASSLLSDFIVPSLALENTTLGEAFRRLGLLIRNEPGQFAAYAILKLGMAFAAIMAVGIGFYIVLFICALIVGLVALLAYLVLHAIGISTGILIGLGVLLAIALYVFVFGYVMMIGNGTVMTFLESYTLYFLGGRYPMLGDLLTASTPPPAMVSPLYPTPYSPYSAPPPPTS